MTDCLHPDFHAEVDINRLFDGIEAGRDLPADRFAIDVRVRCLACGADFEFVGLPAGMSPEHPTVGASRTELHAPMVPPGEAVKAGGLGYSVRAVGDDPPRFRKRRPD